MGLSFVCKVRKSVIMLSQLGFGVVAASTTPAAAVAPLPCPHLQQADTPARWRPERLQALLDQATANGVVPGVAVGLITPQGRCVLGSGRSGNAARPQVDGHTLFELASISKGFTGALLAEAERRGEVRLDEGIAQSFGGQLPEPLRGNPSLDALTWRQLSTHTSGLPRIPLRQWAFIKAMARDPEDPYAHYGVQDFYAYLRGLDVRAPAGYAYSNSGVTLLGMLLAARAGKDLANGYGELVQQRLLTPLKLNDTRVGAPADPTRMARGHDHKGQPVPPWTMNFWTPTGGIVANVEDTLALLQAALDGHAPLVRAMGGPQAEALAPYGKKGGGVALNWHLARQGSQGGEPAHLAWHNGGTFGMRSFAGVDLARGIAVVVLTNTGASDFSDELGLHLWDARHPVPSTAAVKAEVWSLPQRLLLLALLPSGLLLARKAWLSRPQVRSASTPTATPEAGGPLRRGLQAWRRAGRPFVSRLEAGLGGLSALASSAFLCSFLPPLSLMGADLYTLWLGGLLLLTGLALTWTRHLPGHHLHTAKARWGALGSLVLALLLLSWVGL